MLHRMVICAWALALAATAHAQRPPQQVKLSASKAFKHKHSKLEIPPTLDGIARSGITALEDDQLDIFVRFDKPDGSEGITVYIYREVAGALPVWFDRARAAIEARVQLYGTPRRIESDLPFTPPGRTNDAGLIAVYAPSTGELKSTGVAMVPLGEWLVKIRYSSATVTPDEMTGKIKGILAALKWPDTLTDAPAALPVKPCTTPLRATERSEPAPDNDASALIGAMMALPHIRGKAEPAQAALPNWCRDDGVEPLGSVYRPDASADTYLIAISDAGRGISVRPDPGAALLGGDAKPSWRIEMLELSRTIAYPSQDRLPPPQQALEIVRSGRYVTSAPSWGKKKNIEINADTLK